LQRIFAAVPSHRLLSEKPKKFMKKKRGRPSNAIREGMTMQIANEKKRRTAMFVSMANCRRMYAALFKNISVFRAAPNTLRPSTRASLFARLARNLVQSTLTGTNTLSKMPTATKLKSPKSYLGKL